MGSALAKAVAGAGASKKRVFCLARSDESMQRASSDGFAVVAGPSELAEKCGVIFVCVKPKDLETALLSIKPFVLNQIIISIAAGKKISFMSEVLGAKKIVRAMPNICALAAESVTAFACHGLDDAEKGTVAKLLESFGTVIELEERHFDCVTALSGSGPAFVARFVEYLAKAGESEGLTAKAARLLALRTVLGTARLMSEKGLSTEQVVDLVSSPAGTTVAGRVVFENGLIEGAVKGALAAARKRSEEMGKNG